MIAYRGWTKNKREQLEKDRDSKVIDLWLQCYTQEAISKETDVPQQTIQRIIEKYTQNGKIAEMGNFSPQLYNIWNFARNNNETKHFMQDVEKYKLHKDFTPQLYNYPYTDYL